MKNSLILLFLSFSAVALLSCGGGNSNPNGDESIICIDVDDDGFTIQVSEAGEHENEKCSDRVDCDDDDSTVFPGAIETLNDGIDQNCDGADGVLTDGDSDGDGHEDGEDNCPLHFNFTQTDGDGDGFGDACDAFPENEDEWRDTDGDGVGDNGDNCPNLSNADGQDDDNDEDGYGDACDAFDDDPTEWLDSDGDGVGDNSDNCPNVENPNQWDTDHDGEGNECDVDDDGDGVHDDYPDNCPLTSNLGQAANAEGVGIACENDADGDGIGDFADNCVTVFNPGQNDDDCPEEEPDPDDGDDAEAPPPVEICDDGIDNDSDGIIDGNDPDCDMDEDGTPDALDPDRDGDGLPNDIDRCPDVDDPWLLTPYHWHIGDNNGTDIPDDGDGIPDNDGIEDLQEMITVCHLGALFHGRDGCAFVGYNFNALTQAEYDAMASQASNYNTSFEYYPSPSNPYSYNMWEIPKLQMVGMFQFDHDDDGVGDACDGD